MRRTAMFAAAVVALAALAGCGQSSTQSAAGGTRASSTAAAGSGVTVTPSTGSPATVFSARFVARASSGTGTEARIGYTVGLTGADGPNCVGVRSVPVIRAVKGRPVVVRLDPARLGGRWCAGAHVLHVFELQRPQCAAGLMCPQLVRVIAVIGPARFEVKS